MPKEQKQPRPRRQTPVSCRFCRIRKLKCDRKSPCSSCVSRKMSCEYEDPSTESESQVLSNSEISARLLRLERLLHDSPGQPSPGLGMSSLGGTPASRDNEADACSQLSLEMRDMDQDIASLEKVYQGRSAVESLNPVDHFAFQVVSLSDLDQVIATSHTKLSDIVGVPQVKRILLPSTSDARILLQKYVEDLEFIHHILHIPSLYTMVDELYESLSNPGQIKLGCLLLFLSIVSSSTYSWTEADSARGLFSCLADARKQSCFWPRVTQEVLETVNRSTKPSLEAVQGAVIHGFLLAHHEDLTDFFPSFQSILASGLHMARTLGLHRIDHPLTVNQSPVQAEIGRRVWWYIVTSDWLACKMLGTREASYQCHVRHIMTRKPLNIEDEDLSDISEPVERPASYPTYMSYTLQRLQLAEHCRRFIDRNTSATSVKLLDDYNNVTDLDNDLQAMLDNLPAFFNMSDTEIASRYQVHNHKATHIARHGHIIHHMIYSFRCKLHIPFLMRGHTDTRFAASRDVCTRTARLIIQSEVRNEQSTQWQVNRYQIGGLVLGMFVASVVLLVELCVNKSGARNSLYRRDVIDAFRLLEKARDKSSRAARFLDSLLTFLHKHHVSPCFAQSFGEPHPETARDTNPIAHPTNPLEQSSAMVNTVPTPESLIMMPLINQNQAQTLYFNAAEDDMSMYFDMLNQSLQQGSDMEFRDWDGLFSELGSFI